MNTIKQISKQPWGLVALTLLVIISLASCTSPATPTVEATQAPVETQAPEPTTALEATKPPADVEWKPEIRPATKAWKIGYGDGLAGIPFTQSVTDSINDVAEQMGVEIVYCDNAYNQEKTVECSNNLVTQGAEGVIFANWVAGTEELISGIFKDAGIPCVAYDGPHPDCVAFGPDNFSSAKEAGKFLGEYAKAQGWDPKEVQLLLVWTPNVPVHQARAEGATAGVQEVIDIPAENIFDIPTEQMGDEIANVTTWTTAHPDAKYVLCFGHSDLPGVNCALALEQAGYIGRAAAASLGASDEALVDLRTRTDEESIFKATISYFPERYGQYLVPIIVDLLEGKTVPERVIPAVEPVTRENVNELYPAQ